MLRLITGIILVLFSLKTPGDNFPAQPRDYVTDDASVLTSEELTHLCNKLGRFEDSSSNQIFVYLARSLQGRDIMGLCQTIFTQWKIGTAKNNGVLIAVFVDDKTFRIHTGYGLEGVLPDIITKHVQDVYMVPHFKTGDYFEGLDAGMEKLIYYSKNEFHPDASASTISSRYSEDKNDRLWIQLGFLINFILLITYIVFLVKNKRLDKMQKGALIFSGFIISTLTYFGAPLLLLLLIGSVLSYYDKMKWMQRFGGGGSGGHHGTSFRSSNSSGSSRSASRSSNSSSGSGFRGGGGGSSGGGGSTSKW